MVKHVYHGGKKGIELFKLLQQKEIGFNTFDFSPTPCFVMLKNKIILVMKGKINATLCTRYIW